MDQEHVGLSGSAFNQQNVLETRQLWWQLYNKMLHPDYGNMLLLVKMEDELEKMFQRRQRYITKQAYDKMINKLHLDTEGQIIDPFVKLEDREDREARQRIWDDMLALDEENEALIR
jgi:hypothetical protein